MTFVQDKESSVVWGMPGAVKKSVAQSKIIALENIGTLISLNSK
jgi:chemotaxis response regulator CheB